MSVNRDEILTAAANGNASALEFLQVFARRAHFVDDICDKAVRPLAADLAQSEAEWARVLMLNPFVNSYRAALLPAMRLALNAWAHSDAMSFRAQGVPPTAEEIQFAATRDVLKGQWHQVVWMVADITGGWEYLHEISAKYRDYDFEAVEQKATEGTKQNPLREFYVPQLRKEANGMPG